MGLRDKRCSRNRYQRGREQVRSLRCDDLTRGLLLLVRRSSCYIRRCHYGQRSDQQIADYLGEYPPDARRVCNANC